jgi:hypothetical protein
MFETFTLLLLAHALSDFTFQSNWMVRHKRGWGFAAHAAILLVTTLLITGHYQHPALYGLIVLHLVIDAGKQVLPERHRATLAAFLTDQAAHLASLAGFAFLFPDLWQTSLWHAHGFMLPIAGGLAGLIIATNAGSYAVGHLMARFDTDMLPKGLPDAGRLIGQLERGLAFLLILVGQPAGIGFLIAAKSVLRFDSTSRDHKASEYVIIGTLASFGWALVVAYGTQMLIEALISQP